MGCCTGTGEQFPVPQKTYQRSGRGGEGEESAVGLEENSATDGAAEGSVINTKPTQGGSSGGAAEAFKGRLHIHLPMLAPLRHPPQPVVVVCG